MVKGLYKVAPYSKSTDQPKEFQSDYIQNAYNSKPSSQLGDTVVSFELKALKNGHTRTHQDDTIDLKGGKPNDRTDGEIVDQKEDGQYIEVYGRRWYILVVFSLLTFTQAAVWNTWGPIAVSCEKAFGWDNTIIALLPNWGPIGSLLAGWLSSWSMDVKGIRMCCLLTAALVTVASTIRCFTSEPPYITWTSNIAAFLNGLAGPISMGMPPVLSATWFPPNQRTTSTAIATLCNYGGVAAAFLIDDADVPRIRHQIMVIMYAECGWCFLLMLMVAVYFPSKPPKPPSTTASKERLDIKSGFRKLMRNKMFLQLCLAYGLPVGIVALWGGVLSVDLKSYDVSEAQAGWIGFYSIIAGCFGCLAMARVSDIFSKNIRQILILLYSLAFLDFLWFNLILVDLIPSSLAQIYVSIITGTLLVNATVPLWFEMACEITYPIAEGITTVVMLMWLNTVGLVFLGLQMIPNIGTAWQNWSILGSIAVGIPVLLLMNDSYNRLNIDQMVTGKI
ncbi:solute carrier family 49 member 4 homolog [Ylistrum balloti]|uniref:solute carrier family 49 member 4 homolog n=1 Tax=Ylistrum balloti TaxID=509963 RepID=UPI002905C836|nr:solute carrier family 49 member 4 homolog [Ylistrum balloti]